MEERSQKNQIMDYADKQPMNIDDFQEMYLFEILNSDPILLAETKAKTNEEIRGFIDEYIRPVADENGHAPVGLMQYYLQLWTDKDFYIWYHKNYDLSEEELEKLKLKAEECAEIFKKDMEELVILDPKILNMRFQEEIMGYTRKKNTLEIYKRLFSSGDIDDWYEKLMEDEELRKMYEMRYEWIEGAQEMNVKCQLLLTLIIRPQQQIKQFTHSR